MGLMIFNQGTISYGLSQRGVCVKKTQADAIYPDVCVCTEAHLERSHFLRLMGKNILS